MYSGQLISKPRSTQQERARPRCSSHLGYNENMHCPHCCELDCTSYRCWRQCIKGEKEFKTGTDGKVTRWWYIIHAEEACLQQLENEWQKVELQTSWKLEPCYRYLESDEQTPLSGEQCPLPEGESEVAPLI